MLNNINELKEFVIHNNLEQCALKALKLNFKKYRTEAPEEYFGIFPDDSDISFNVQTISLKLGNWPDCNYNHIVVYIPIYVANVFVGEYTVMFTMDGKIDDDMFSIK